MHAAKVSARSQREAIGLCVSLIFCRAAKVTDNLCSALTRRFGVLTCNSSLNYAVSCFTMDRWIFEKYSCIAVCVKF